MKIGRQLLTKLKNCAFVVFLFSTSLVAQEIVVQGKVTDAGSGDPIPFATVLLKGTTVGVTTDFDGNFILFTTTKGDSIVVSTVGYKPRTKAVKSGRQVINFQMEEDVKNLKELVIA